MEMSPVQIEERVRSLGRWFHNIDLRGVKTAPDHFLGDYPNIKWQHFAHAIPADLSGKSRRDCGHGPVPGACRVEHPILVLAPGEVALCATASGEEHQGGRHDRGKRGRADA